MVGKRIYYIKKREVAFEWGLSFPHPVPLSLGTFLPPLVQNVKNAVHKPQGVPLENSSPVPESLLGQASVDNESTDDSNNFDSYLRQLCPNEHPHDIIMKVKAEEDIMEGAPPFCGCHSLIFIYKRQCHDFFHLIATLLVPHLYSLRRLVISLKVSTQHTAAVF